MLWLPVAIYSSYLDIFDVASRSFPNFLPVVTMMANVLFKYMTTNKYFRVGYNVNSLLPYAKSQPLEDGTFQMSLYYNAQRINPNAQTSYSAECRWKKGSFNISTQPTMLSYNNKNPGYCQPASQMYKAIAMLPMQPLLLYPVSSSQHSPLALSLQK